jgi:hypothetical protein
MEVSKARSLLLLPIESYLFLSRELSLLYCHSKIRKMIDIIVMDVSVLLSREYIM